MQRSATATGLQVPPLRSGGKRRSKAPLRLLAKDRGQDAVKRAPDKAFNRLLAQYGLLETLPAIGQPEADPAPAHPYIAMDMSLCVHCDRCIRICEEVEGQFVWKAIGRGSQRRIVAGMDETMLQSVCVSCGACVDTCPTGALEDRRLLELGQPDAWTRTTCSYCGTGCEMEVGTLEGSIVTVRPVLDGPANHGYLCIKGRFGTGFNHAPDRILHPLVRREGEWVCVSWEEALNVAAGALNASLQAGGPDNVAVLASSRATNEACYLAQKLARVVLGTNSVDCCARVCHAPSAAGLDLVFGTGAASSSFEDI